MQVLIDSGIINYNSNVHALIYFQQSFISEGRIYFQAWKQPC